MSVETKLETLLHRKVDQYVGAASMIDWEALVKIAIDLLDECAKIALGCSPARPDAIGEWQRATAKEIAFYIRKMAQQDGTVPR